MELQTGRLTLRPWREEDAAALYEVAKDPRVGPIAGWPVHTSVENSRQIIRDVLMADETYAVVLRGQEDPIGSIGLMIGGQSNLGIPGHEGEIGYWLGVPFWGQGLIPEAVRELMRHGFEDLGLTCLWCGYFDGNEKSHRVSEKCGFRYHHTEYEKPYPLIHEAKTQHVTRITRQEWQDDRTDGIKRAGVAEPLFMEQMEVRKLRAFTFLIPKSQVKGYDIEVTVEYTKKSDDENIIAANAWVRAGDGYVKGFVATVFVPVCDDPVESIMLELGKEPSFADEAIRFIETIDGPGL